MSFDESQALIEAIRAWANTNGRGIRTGGSLDGHSTFQLVYNPESGDPEKHVTFTAELVNGRPVIRISHSGEGRPEEPRPAHAESRNARAFGFDDGSPREPTATCDACGAVGTIGRATRRDENDAIVDQYRFCLACWPEQSARFEARWDEERRVASDRFLRSRGESRPHHYSTSFASATWHAALKLIHDFEVRRSAASAPALAMDMTALASVIRANAPELEGEMPFAVEAFLYKYGA